MMRAGRMLAQGDLRLLALALIAEQPRHGYEIIKVLEEKTEGWYAPSPGIVYPTLTYLEEAGYVTAQADGAKRLYTITGEGRGYLEGEPRLRRCGAGAARCGRRARRPIRERQREGTMDHAATLDAAPDPGRVPGSDRNGSRGVAGRTEREGAGDRGARSRSRGIAQELNKS